MQPFKSESFGFGQTAVELNKHSADDVASKISGQGTNIDANLWLPAAAVEYHISPKIEDYVLVPVPAMWTDIPNTNGDSVTIQEYLKFNPEMGMQAFKTFRGKPTFLEHDNRDITKAKGVILDAYLRRIKNFGGGKYFKLVLLLAYDRSKDPMLVNQILSGQENAYSVGFYYRAYSCALCGATVGMNTNEQPCSHTMPRKPTYMKDDGSNKLVYRRCHDVVGFECSSVSSPAFISAVSPVVMDPQSV